MLGATIRALCLLLLLGAAALLASLAAAAPIVQSVGPFEVTFYNNGDADEEGSSIQDWTTQQIDDVAATLNTWSSRILNTPGRQINLHVFWASLGGSTLGQTLNPYSGDGTNAWTLTERVWREGVNYSTSSSYDARITFNTSGVTWNFGPGTPGSGQYDFRSASTHELGHPLGFFSTYFSLTDQFSSLGITAWDRNLLDDAGNRPAPSSTGTPGNFNEVSNPVWFTGTNAVA